MFKRRLSGHPHDLGQTPIFFKCPGIWELEDGDFAIIGEDITDITIEAIPLEASVWRGEKVVRIPRATLVSAKNNIPEG